MAKIGEGLRGLGMYWAGQGAQFEQNQLKEQESAREAAILEEAKRKQQTIEDSFYIHSALANNRPDAAMSVLQRRLQRQKAAGVDTTTTMQHMKALQSGDLTSVLQDVTAVIDYANQFGGGAGGASRTPAAMIEFNEKVKIATDPNADPVAKNAALVDLGINPRAKGPQITDVAGVPYLWVPSGDGTEGILQPMQKGPGGAYSITPTSVGEDKGTVAQGEQAGKDAQAEGGKFFDMFRKTKGAIRNYDSAISAVDRGATSGQIERLFPTFRAVTLELEQIRNELGLDIIGATTFGALSESELQFALDTAMPAGMDQKALREWLVKKKTAQEKLMNEYRDAAMFLMTPGNTMKDYLEQMKSDGTFSMGGDKKGRELSIDELVEMYQ